MEAAQLLKKLQWKEGMQGLLINAPAAFTALVQDQRTFDVAWEKHLSIKYDVVMVFGAQKKDLEHACVFNALAGKFDAIFWACYPKGTGSIKSDLKRDIVWHILDLIGLKAVTQIAIDDTWSALRGRPPQVVGR